jgi:hypothetical protein
MKHAAVDDEVAVYPSFIYSQPFKGQCQSKFALAERGRSAQANLL